MTKKGTKVLIQATIVRQCLDRKPDEQKGYIVETSRGTVMVAPHEILYREDTNDTG